MLLTTVEFFFDIDIIAAMLWTQKGWMMNKLGIFRFLKSHF
jgi:hypothetical protein